MSQFHQFKEMRYWQKKKEWQKKTIYAALEMSATEFLSGCLLLLEPAASIVFRTLFPVILFYFPVSYIKCNIFSMSFINLMWKKTMGQLTHADYTEFTGYEPSSVIVFLKPRRKTRYWLCPNDEVKKIFKSWLSKRIIRRD